MALKTTAKKRSKTVATGANSDSFVYRGVRIMRTWTTSKRSEQIREAMRKVYLRGPAQTSAR